MGECYVYVSVFLAHISILAAAGCITWSSPMLPKLNTTDDNPLGRIISSSENSILASLNTWAACFGAIIFGNLTFCFGRKTLLIATGFFSLVAFLAMSVAKNIWLLYICRILNGISLGATFSIVPIYTGELADVNNRGILGSSITVFVNIGLLIPYVVGPYVSFFWFHIILACFPAVFIPLFFLLAPESPHYLIKRNVSEADAVLKKLRGRDDVSDELEYIRKGTENLKRGSLLNILETKALRKGFFICLGLYTFLELTGNAIVASYNERIFEIANVGMSPEIAPIIVAVFQLMTAIVFSSIADKFSRKLLLLISFAGIALVEIPFGAYFYLEEKKYDLISISWFPLLCLIIFVWFYNFGIGPMMMTLLAELFPAKEKGIAVSCLVVYKWGGSSVLTMLFNTLNDTIGVGCMFWIFATSCCVATVFIKFFVVETKGKTFQEIQEALSQ